MKVPLWFLWTANVLGWPILQLGLAKASLLIPEHAFSSEGYLYRSRSWEGNGAFYRRWLRIRKWKHLLPDGAVWVGGNFRKKKLKARDLNYLQNFITETRRAEFAHWLMILCAPIFYLWNPPWACMVMTIYAFLANLPCILTQRYNRFTLLKLTEGR